MCIFRKRYAVSRLLFLIHEHFVISILRNSYTSDGSEKRDESDKKTDANAMVHRRCCSSPSGDPELDKRLRK